MSKITFPDRDPVEAEIIESLKDQIRKDCKYFFSKVDNCVYFVVDELLYGFAKIEGLDLGSLDIFWLEDSAYEFTISKITGKEILSKAQPRKTTILEYPDILTLYTTINMNINLK